MILLSASSSLEATIDRGKRLCTNNIIYGDEKGSVIKFASKVLDSMKLKNLGGPIETPWNDDIIVHFRYNLNAAMNTFIHISHDSGLDYALYCVGEELSKEYIDKIKRIYGKSFERRKDGDKN